MLQGWIYEVQKFVKDSPQDYYNLVIYLHTEAGPCGELHRNITSMIGIYCTGK